MRHVSLAVSTLLLLLFAHGIALSDERSQRHSDAGRTVRRELTHADRERDYLLHLPSEMQTGKPVPLVIALHGLSMDGRSMEWLTGFSKVSDDQGFVVAYPNGLNRMWRFWERHELGERVLKEPGFVDDVGFLEAMIDELIADGLVDGSRVYVTGHSNGAYMSNRLACSLSDRIAAIAPVAGTMVPALSGTTPPRAMPVLYIHGTNDHIVGFDGVDGFTKKKSSLTADELVEWWAGHNACLAPHDPESLEDTTDDQTRVVRCLHPACEDGAPVVFYKIDGAGHTWPGGALQPQRFLGRTCHDINASAVIWEFFSEHTLPESAVVAQEPSQTRDDEAAGQ